MLEATPGDHWFMRVITALATSRVLRTPLLRFYAAASGRHSLRSPGLVLACACLLFSHFHLLAYGVDAPAIMLY